MDCLVSLVLNVVVGFVFDYVVDFFFVLATDRRFILQEILVSGVALGACLWQIEADSDVSPERVEGRGREHLLRCISRKVACCVSDGSLGRHLPRGTSSACTRWAVRRCRSLRAVDAPLCRVRSS